MPPRWKKLLRKLFRDTHKEDVIISEASQMGDPIYQYSWRSAGPAPRTLLESRKIHKKQSSRGCRPVKQKPVSKWVRNRERTKLVTLIARRAWGLWLDELRERLKDVNFYALGKEERLELLSELAAQELTAELIGRLIGKTAISVAVLCHREGVVLRGFKQRSRNSYLHALPRPVRRPQNKIPSEPKRRSRAQKPLANTAEALVKSYMNVLESLAATEEFGGLTPKGQIRAIANAVGVQPWVAFLVLAEYKGLLGKLPALRDHVSRVGGR